MNCLLALCLQLGLGFSHANTENCGIWYMCGVLYPHQLNVTNVAATVAVQKGNWRVEGSYDGKFRSAATTGPDATSSFDTCGGVPGPNCPAEHFYTDGKEQNLCVEWVAHLGQHLQAELGPCVYHATFTVNVVDWVYQGQPGGRWLPQPVNMSANKWNPGFAAGIAYSFTPHTAAAIDVKMCELRGLDNNLNNMPSLCKGILGETTFRWTF